MRAFKAYARENQSQLPASFEQAEPFWPKELKKTTNNAADQYEILYHGSLDALTNRNVIVFREKKLWRYGNEKYGKGKLGRLDVLASGSSQYGSAPNGTPDGDFNNWEKADMAPQTSP